MQLIAGLPLYWTILRGVEQQVARRAQDAAWDSCSLPVVATGHRLRAGPPLLSCRDPESCDGLRDEETLT